MPVQQQMASFASKLGAKVAQANAEHADKPIDTGNRRLPAGIRDGVARLETMYTKEYEDGDNKGKVFFRASASVIGHMVRGQLVEDYNGEKISGLITSKMIPLFDVPARGERKEKTFSDNWFEFQNLFKMLGIVPPRGPQYDLTGDPARDAAAGAHIQAYYFGAMKTLTDPARKKSNPIYITFSTRGWTPPPTPKSPNPEEMVFEEWHGQAAPPPPPDPAAGVTAAPPRPNSSAPQTQVAPTAPPPPAHSPTAPPSAPYEPSDEGDPEELVAALVAAAMEDPHGETEEGATAGAQLEDMALANGWTKDQTTGAADWATVGEMALRGPGEAEPSAEPIANGAVTVGSRWYFAKRTKDGNKLSNSKGEPFPSQEVEVTSVDEVALTCHLKYTKDDKTVMDLRGKAPLPVKFDWLEKVPY